MLHFGFFGRGVARVCLALRHISLWSVLRGIRLVVRRLHGLLRPSPHTRRTVGDLPWLHTLHHHNGADLALLYLHVCRDLAKCASFSTGDAFMGYGRRIADDGDIPSCVFLDAQICSVGEEDMINVVPLCLQF